MKIFPKSLSVELIFPTLSLILKSWQAPLSLRIIKSLSPLMSLVANEVIIAILNYVFFLFMRLLQTCNKTLGIADLRHQVSMTMSFKIKEL